MSLIIPNISAGFFLNLILGQKNASSTQYLKLYKNDHVPTKNTILNNFVEADYSGYYAITLNQSKWNIDTVSGITSASYPEQTFVIEEKAYIYGYYITSIINSTEYLMWAERFANAPVKLPEGGGSFAISLNLGLGGVVS